jgi:hypothetical protein
MMSYELKTTAARTKVRAALPYGVAKDATPNGGIFTKVAFVS